MDILLAVVMVSVMVAVTVVVLPPQLRISHFLDWRNYDTLLAEPSSTVDVDNRTTSAFPVSRYTSGRRGLLSRLTGIIRGSINDLNIFYYIANNYYVRFFKLRTVNTKLDSERKYNLTLTIYFSVYTKLFD